MASLRKSERLISSRGHGCFTISPPQLPATATRFPSHGTGRPGLELRTATKLSSAGFEPTAALTFGLRVRRLNHSATRSRRHFFSKIGSWREGVSKSAYLDVNRKSSSIFSKFLLIINAFLLLETKNLGQH